MHKVLFVDDEPAVLDGYRRMLRRVFDVHVAPSGARGLLLLRSSGPYSVVISDMRMPAMNGAEFLAQVRQKAPDTVRMLLTGYTDIDAAIAAVNEGNIFRFLTKPCEKETLVKAINIGLVQYGVATAERELVKKAQLIEDARSAVDDDGEICTWDNCQGPTGLRGPTQAREYLAPLLGVDPQCYVVLLKLTMHHTVELRYGEEAGDDYLNMTAQVMIQTLRSNDQLFHWGRDSLMAVVRRQMPLAAVRMELSRRTSTNQEYLIKVGGRDVMIASPIAFDLQPASKFTSLDEMLTVLASNLMGTI